MDNILDYLLVADKVYRHDTDAFGCVQLTVACEKRDLYCAADIEYKALLQKHNIGRDLIIHCAIKLDDDLFDQILENATSEIFLH